MPPPPLRLRPAPPAPPCLLGSRALFVGACACGAAGSRWRAPPAPVLAGPFAPPLSAGAPVRLCGALGRAPPLPRRRFARGVRRAPSSARVVSAPRASALRVRDCGGEPPHPPNERPYPLSTRRPKSVNILIDTIFGKSAGGLPPAPPRRTNAIVGRALCPPPLCGASLPRPMPRPPNSWGLLPPHPRF